MTTGKDVFLETVSLNDDEEGNVSAHLDHLEAQLPVFANGTPATAVVKSARDASIPNPIAETDDEDEDDGDDDVVVIVDPTKTPEKPRPTPPSLPPLRVLELNKNQDRDNHDTVDPTLFSPEVSRHSMEQAHRRARSLESELKELAALEGTTTAAPVKITPLEAVSIISGAFTSSFTRVKQLVSGGTEYDLLSGSSPLSKIDDLDTDGDGLQLSPDGSRGDGKHFPVPKIKPALKPISAYSSIEKERKATPPRRRLQWHEDVLDQDEEFVDGDEDDGETEALMVNGNGAIANRQATPRSRKKRKKLVRGMMRRLTPREKEELYRQRPDLMIIPNWAQKYREEMSESESTRWSFWLLSIIGTLVILLVILIMLIARDRAESAASK